MRSFSHMGQTYKLLAQEDVDYGASSDDPSPYSNWLNAVNEPIFHPLKHSDVSAIEEALINDLPINLDKVISTIISRNVEKFNKTSPLVAGYWRSASSGGQRQFADAKINPSRAEGVQREAIRPRGAIESQVFILQPEHLSTWFGRVRKIADKTQAAYVKCLLLTGASPHELIRLKWADLDFDKQIMRINNGEAGERTIPLTPYLSRRLFELRDARPIEPRGLSSNDGQLSLGEFPIPSQKVFVRLQTKNGGIRLSLTAYENALANAGLSALTLMSLRESFAAYCARAGVPLDIVHQITGNNNKGFQRQHPNKRSLEVLRMWHNKVESWILAHVDSHTCTVPQDAISQQDQVEIETPDENAVTVEAQLLDKNLSQPSELDDRILMLYAKGLSPHEIVVTFKEVCDMDVSTNTITKVIDQVTEQVTAWQNRPLPAVYPVVYLDRIELKIHDGPQVVSKPLYLAVGLNAKGYKDILGFWLSEERGVPFWTAVLKELKNRGIQDILIACVDGITGFSEAIEGEYPQTRLQICIFHMVRSSLEYVTPRDCSAISNDLKRIYQATNEDQALAELELFDNKWGARYPHIRQSWTTHWPELRTLFTGPPEIRKAIYTSNVMEPLNKAIRSATKHREIFPTDRSAKEVIYLVLEEQLKKCVMPIRNWNLARSRFDVEFGNLLVADANE